MDIDQSMRYIFIAGFLVVAPIARYYRVKSHSTGEKIDRKQEGSFVYSTLRPVALLRIVGVFAFMINPAWMAWSRVELHDTARWIGVGTMALVSLLFVSVFRSLGKNLTDTVGLRKEHTLVTDGPYRFVRHPLYTAAFVAIIGDSLMTANWYLFVTGVIVLAILAVRTKKEEENLIERFGDDYREYATTTGRFFPRL